MIPASRPDDELGRTQHLLHDSRVGSIYRFPCTAKSAEVRVASRAPTLGFVHGGIGVVRLRGRERHVDANQLLLLLGGPFPVRHLGCADDLCATALTLSCAATTSLAASMGVSEPQLRGIFSGRVVMRSPSLQKRAHLLVHAARAAHGEGSAVVDRRLVQLFGEVALLVLGQRAMEPFQRRGLEKVRFTLSTRLEEPPTLGELASTAGCTRFHLCRVFKEETGLTITEYVHGLRLHEAILDLSTDGDDLSTLAVRLGYSSHSHFTNRFRRYYGMTPSALRDQMKEEAAGRHPAERGDVESREGVRTANRGIPDHPAPPSLEVRQ